MTARLHSADGAVLSAPEWVVDADAVDRRVLERAVAPVLDVGCGPGRHAAALARAGHIVLGIDIAASAVVSARRRGALTLERSIFDRIPGAGRWRSALLLDGNVGIGGDPVALLARVRALLAPAGLVIVEAAPPGAGRGHATVRLDLAGCLGPWFALATVPITDVVRLGRDAGFALDESWQDGGRWFAALRSQ